MDQEGKIIIEIKNLSKNYGETKALRGINLQFKDKEVHTIFGENGSGKSTMIKILSGIITPSSGEIFFQGNRIMKFEPRFSQMLGIVPVLQEILVAPNRTVLDNIFLGYDGMFKRRIPLSKRPIEALYTLDKITQKKINLNEIVGLLPLYQKQLIVIARALLHKPKVLILDEPTSSLDIEDRNMLFKEINNLINGGCLVIYISHRLDEVLEISDRVTVLVDGKDVCTIPKAELTTEAILENVIKK